MNFKAHARSIIVWISVGFCVLELFTLIQFYWERDISLPYDWHELSYFSGSGGGIYTDSEWVEHSKQTRATALSELSVRLENDNVTAVAESLTVSLDSQSGFTYTLISDPEHRFSDWLIDGRSLTVSENDTGRIPVWAIKDTLYAEAYYQDQTELTFLGLPCEIVGVFDYLASPLSLSRTAAMPTLIAQIGQLPMDQLNLAVNVVDPALQTDLAQLLPVISAQSSFKSSMKVQSGNPLLNIVQVMLGDKFTLLILAIIAILLASAVTIIILEISLLRPIYAIHDLCGSGVRGLLKQALRHLFRYLLISDVVVLFGFYLIHGVVFSGSMPMPHFSIVLGSVLMLTILYLLVFSFALMIQRTGTEGQNWKQVTI